MSKRLLGVLMLLLLAFAMAAPAMAVEAEGDEEELEVEHEELPAYDEVGTGSETAKQFRPEPYEQPSLFRALLYPLLIIALIALVGVLILYLWWQPRFSQEREEKKRR